MRKRGSWFAGRECSNRPDGSTFTIDGHYGVLDTVEINAAGIVYLLYKEAVTMESTTRRS